MKIDDKLINANRNSSKRFRRTIAIGKLTVDGVDNAGSFSKQEIEQSSKRRGVRDDGPKLRTKRSSRKSR